MVLLRLMEKVTKEHINSIDTDLAYKMIRLGSAELTQTQVCVLLIFPHYFLISPSVSLLSTIFTFIVFLSLFRKLFQSGRQLPPTCSALWVVAMLRRSCRSYSLSSRLECSLTSLLFRHLVNLPPAMVSADILQYQ